MIQNKIKIKIDGEVGIPCRKSRISVHTVIWGRANDGAMTNVGCSREVQ